MRYRKEIDGLRAFAVIPVIFFHADFNSFSGGFVGVDVFFVISGYLITTIILTEKQAGDFSLLNFYQRRARRILPALFFVLICCLPFVWAWMLPDQLLGFARSLVATSIFCSNIYFQQEEGYFAPANEEIPLLHTWSLAVEEQYYIIFPLCIILLWRFGKNRVFSLIILAAIVSLGFAEWDMQGKGHFYSSLKRAWEILVGALCAFHLLKNTDHKGGQWLSLCGIGLIIFAVFALDRNTPFPSLYTLIPVLGAALIILFGTQKTIVSRMLSMPIFVGIGLISYSAYLWHQPLFAFARIRSLNDPSQAQYLFLSVLSLALGWATWRYVEQPFRIRQGNKLFLSRAKFTAGAIGGAFFFIVIGVIGQNNNGFDGRLNAQVLYLLQNGKVGNPREKECFKKPLFSSGDSAPCIYGSPDQVKIVLLGDSHANSLVWELGRALDEIGLGLIQINRPACLPIRGLQRNISWSKHLKCQRVNEAAFEYLKSGPVDTVVLAARWTLAIEGERFNNLEGGVERGGRRPVDMVGNILSGSEGERKAKVASGYIKGITEFLSLGKKVILVYPIPEAGWTVPTYLAKASISGEDFGGMLSTSYKRFKSRNKSTYAAFDAIEHPSLVRVKPGEILCDSYVKGRCLNQLNGVPLYSDDNHLSNAGAKLVVDRIVSAIQNSQ